MKRIGAHCYNWSHWSKYSSSIIVQNVELVINGTHYSMYYNQIAASWQLVCNLNYGIYQFVFVAIDSLNVTSIEAPEYVLIAKNNMG